MTVYVDDMNAPYRGMYLCHMIADTDEELHLMAARIGVARKWHQAPPKHDSHYDICLSKKKLALQAGAVAIDLRTLAMMNMYRRQYGKLLTPIDAIAWFTNKMMQSPQEKKDGLRQAQNGQGTQPEVG